MPATYHSDASSSTIRCGFHSKPNPLFSRIKSPGLAREVTFRTISRNGQKVCTVESQGSKNSGVAFDVTVTILNLSDHSAKPRPPTSIA